MMCWCLNKQERRGVCVTGGESEKMGHVSPKTAIKLPLHILLKVSKRKECYQSTLLHQKWLKKSCYNSVFIVLQLVVVLFNTFALLGHSFSSLFVTWISLTENFLHVILFPVDGGSHEPIPWVIPLTRGCVPAESPKTITSIHVSLPLVCVWLSVLNKSASHCFSYCQSHFYYVTSHTDPDVLICTVGLWLPFVGRCVSLTNTHTLLTRRVCGNAVERTFLSGSGGSIANQLLHSAWPAASSVAFLHSSVKTADILKDLHLYFSPKCFLCSRLRGTWHHDNHCLITTQMLPSNAWFVLCFFKGIMILAIPAISVGGSD